MLSLLFSVQLTHSYYKDGLLPQARLVPDEDTRALLQRYQIVLDYHLSTVSAYYQGGNQADEFLCYLETVLEQQPLRFILLNHDTHFNLRTDLPFDWCGDINWTSRDTITASQATATHKYVQLQAVLFERSLVLTEQLGALTLYVADLLAQPELPIHYQIKFESRSTYWNYLLFNVSGVKLHQPAIEPNEVAHFSLEKDPVSINGKQARCFRASVAMALSEIPSSTFSLTDSNQFDLVFDESAQGNKNKVLIHALPTPFPDSITLENIDGQQRVCSQIYVYL